MKVSELISQLSRFDPDKEVYVASESRKDEKTRAVGEGIFTDYDNMILDDDKEWIEDLDCVHHVVLIHGAVQ